MARTMIDQVNDHLLGFDIERNNSKSFSLSCFNDAKGFNDFDDRDLFFDVDITLPNKCENTATIDSSSLSQEFDFCMGFSRFGSIRPCDISPADKLFYKGRLLPLYLPTCVPVADRMSSLAAGQNELGRDFSSMEVSCFLLSDDRKNCRTSQTKDNVISPRSHWKCDCADCQDIGSNVWTSNGNGVGKNTAGVSKGSLYQVCFEGNHCKARDTFLFPNCYKDPILLCQNQPNVDVNFSVKEKIPSSGRLKLNMFLPRLKKSMNIGKVVTYKGKEIVAKLTDSKEHKWFGSILKVGTSAFFLKSLLIGESRKDLDNEQKTADDQERSEDRQSATSWEVKYGSSSVQLDKDHLLSKAREYFQRYLKILRPTSRKMIAEESEALSEQFHSQLSSGMTSQRQTDEHFSGELSGSLFLKRPGDCIPATACLTLAARSQSASFAVDHSESTKLSSSIMELQSAIQGAIAHCKHSQVAGMMMNH
eukprot:c29808_g1_i1 orf=800-2230(+)